MSLNKAATKLLQWLRLYKISATEYQSRISGARDQEYNVNRLIGNFSSARGGEPRESASPKRGLFKTALQTLITYGY